MPKLLAAITIAAPFIAVSAFLTSSRGVPRRRAGRRSRSPSSAVVGVALYASAFVWLGLVSARRRSAIGLLYIVLWEGFFSGFVSGVRLLSIRHYAIALMHGLDPRRFASVDVSPNAAVVLSLLVFGGFLVFSVRRLRRMDVP